MTPALRNTVTAALVAALVAASPLAAVAVPADTVDAGTPGHLVVDLEPAVFDVALDPGEHDDWLVTVRSEAPTPGLLSYDFQSEGALASDAAGARFALDECPVPWSGALGATQCADARALIVDQPFSEIGELVGRELGTIAPGDSRHLRIRVTLPEAMPDTLQGAEADFALQFRGVGTTATVETGRPGEIAVTGIDSTQPFIIAIAIILAGAVLTLLVRTCRTKENGS